MEKVCANLRLRTSKEQNRTERRTIADAGNVMLTVELTRLNTYLF